MKVGILTLPLSDNYGGMLQAAALYRVLGDMGHEPVLLAKKFWRPVSHQLLGRLLRAVPGHDYKKTRSMEKARARHYPFLKRSIPNQVGPLYTDEALSKAIDTLGLDAVIVGSDQVWRPDYIEDVDTASFFLDLEGDFRKISYAASFGKSEWNAPHRLTEVRRMLADFDAVSLREVSGMTLCKETLHRASCTLALDPTMLVTAGFYDDIIARPEPVEKPYVLNYVLDHSDVVDAALARALEGPARGSVVKTLTLNDGANTVDVPNWVRAFKDAEYVVTDSFHGTLFAILFQKPFVCIGNSKRGVDRFTSILDLLGLGHRLVLGMDDLGALDGEVNYASVAPRLEAQRKLSRAFLEQALAPERVTADV